MTQRRDSVSLPRPRQRTNAPRYPRLLNTALGLGAATALVMGTASCMGASGDPYDIGGAAGAAGAGEGGAAPEATGGSGALEGGAGGAESQPAGNGAGEGGAGGSG